MGSDSRLSADRTMTLHHRRTLTILQGLRRSRSKVGHDRKPDVSWTLKFSLRSPRLAHLYTQDLSRVNEIVFLRMGRWPSLHCQSESGVSGL